MPRLGVLLFCLIVVCTCASVLLQLRFLRIKHRSDDVLHRVDAMLRAWAEHGDWNPILKDKLVRIARGED